MPCNLFLLYSKVNQIYIHTYIYTYSPSYLSRVPCANKSKTRAEINETEMKKTIVKINEKINRIDKSLGRLIKKKRRRTQIKKIKNERKVTAGTAEIQRMVRDCYQ